MYKGGYVYTITEMDITHPFRKELHGKVNIMKLLDTMGRLLPCDIGKRVYEQSNGIYQVENDAQLKQRLNRSV